MPNEYFRGVRIVAIGAALTLVPLNFNIGDGFYPQAKAGSSHAGGNGQGGGHGHAGQHGKGEGKNNISEFTLVVKGKVKSELHPSKLGRLNAFMNASPKALQNSSAKSAIGIVAVQYAGALSSYIDAVNLGQLPHPTLDDAAAILAKAANKPLSPEIVAAINERLAAENPDNPSLAGLADPANEDVNNQLAVGLSDLANTLQDSETNQGLGTTE
jgi:hypothetical protein